MDEGGKGEARMEGNRVGKGMGAGRAGDALRRDNRSHMRGIKGM